MTRSGESRLARALDRTVDAAFVIDPAEDRFLAASAAGCGMLGYSLEALLARPVSQIHAGEVPQLQDVVGRVLRDGRVSSVTLTCRRSSGTCVPTEMALWAFRDDDGRFFVFALVRDRSEHRARGR